jgi:FkbM family methyltransferase
MLKPADFSKLHPVVCNDLKRLGARHDGGYVVPMRSVSRAKYLLSFGVSFDWSFEAAFLHENPNAAIHCYDHTITGRRVAMHSLKGLVAGAVEPGRFQDASKYFSYRSFFRGRVQHHQSRVWYNHDMDSVTVHDAFDRLGPRGEVFLKIDIEGSEYRILHDIDGFTDRIDAIAIEFHDIDIMADTFDAAVARLRKAFHIVHVHPDNTAGLSPSGQPNALEITFLNRALFEGEPARSEHSYPVIGLDAKNDPVLPDLKLHFGE